MKKPPLRTALSALVDLNAEMHDIRVQYPLAKRYSESTSSVFIPDSFATTSDGHTRALIVESVGLDASRKRARVMTNPPSLRPSAKTPSERLGGKGEKTTQYDKPTMRDAFSPLTGYPDSVVAPSLGQLSSRFRKLPSSTVRGIHPFSKIEVQVFNLAGREGQNENS
jgi:hypothetical protein